MSKKSEVLKGEPRTKVGTRASRALRAQGRIPAALDSDDKHGRADIHIEEHNFIATRRRHTHLYEIDVGGKLNMVVVRKLQWDTFGESIIHIDFKRVQRDVKTDSVILLDFVGHPKSGVLNHLIGHVTVRCIPELIPDVIEVPVGHLELNGVIYGREIKAPEGVEILLSPDARVAAAVAIKIEVEPTVAAAEGAAVAAAAATPAAGAAAALGATPAAGAAPAAAAAPAKKEAAAPAKKDKK